MNNTHYPQALALNQPAKKLVVFLHGVGSDGHDLISLVPYIQNSLPDCHFISPHGIEAYDMAPFGRQWFSLRDRSAQTILKLAAQNSLLIEEIISQKQQELGLKHKDTILIGFSQGSMIGSYLTLTAKEPYAAMIAFSGRLIPPANITNTQTPICIIHGKDDDVVSANEADTFAEYCAKNNIVHDKLVINNLVHSIDDKGLKFALEFLKKRNMTT